MVSALKPANVKMTMFAKLNYLIFCSHIQPKKIHNVKQCVIDYISVLCEAFSIFRLVPEKIYFELGELIICRSSSHESA